MSKTRLKTLVLSFNWDSNDQITDVELLGDFQDSLLKVELTQMISNQSSTSRIVMNKKINSIEAYLFRYGNEGLEPTWKNTYYNLVKFPYFEHWPSPDLIDSIPETPEEETADIFTIVEDMPHFPGGESEIYKYLAQNTRYPPEAKDNGEQGIVFVTFVVDEFGHIEETRVLRGVSESLDREAVRVINAMPLWRPGFQKGQPVKVQFNMPIRFILRG